MDADVLFAQIAVKLKFLSREDAARVQRGRGALSFADACAASDLLTQKQIDHVLKHRQLIISRSRGQLAGAAPSAAREPVAAADTSRRVRADAPTNERPRASRVHLAVTRPQPIARQTNKPVTIGEPMIERGPAPTVQPSAVGRDSVASADDLLPAGGLFGADELSDAPTFAGGGGLALDTERASKLGVEGAEVSYGGIGEQMFEFDDTAASIGQDVAVAEHAGSTGQVELVSAAESAMALPVDGYVANKREPSGYGVGGMRTEDLFGEGLSTAESPSEMAIPVVTVEPDMIEDHVLPEIYRPQAAPSPMAVALQRAAAAPVRLDAAPQDVAPSPRVAPIISARGAVEMEPLEGMLAQLLNTARQHNAADAHFVAGQPPAIRVAGRLRRWEQVVSADQVEQALAPLLKDARQQQLEEAGSADFAFVEPKLGRFRVNIAYYANGLKACFRLIPKEVPSLETLGLPHMLARVIDYHQGLALVSGPNGHGKTTTLSALVELLNQQRAKHIITIEDPVEFTYSAGRALINQREVGVNTRSFARALKAALREDPDVIVIGELRDQETVEIALEAAETGHLVIATMSTRSGAKTIDRLIDMFPPSSQAAVRATLAGALKMVIAQRLVPNLRGDGLVAAVEMISGNIQLWNLIRDNKLIQLPSLMQRGVTLGMIRFDTSLRLLVEQNKISRDVAIKNADDPRQLLADIEGRGSAAEPSQSARIAPPVVRPAAAAALGQAQPAAQGQARRDRGLFRKRR
ncbi:MAG: PilT/PilU family type 4a pilus ATPase [Deltaproteobacteria bacterium]|nr:PilT/PilU family type 4a pilus ATPase [Deltaproteobacteria bacterium]